jgi:putative membrane protein
MPSLFEAALADETVHVAQHATFFVSALFLWWSILGRNAGRADAASVASLFATMMHTSALGALLSFAPTAWYAAYTETAAFGLTPLEDQQLGGFVMWVPGGLAYVIAALGVIASYLRPARTWRGLGERGR